MQEMYIIEISIIFAIMVSGILFYVLKDNNDFL